MSQSFSRRDFLAKTAAFAAAGAVLANGLPARADDEGFGGLPIGIQSYTLRSIKGFDELIKTVSETLKIKRIEFYRGHFDPASTPEKIAEMKKKCADAGIAIEAFGVEGFSKDHDANKKKFEFGKALGVKSLSADPTPDSFDSLDKLCEEYKIPIAIHPHGPGHRWGKLAVIEAAIKDHHKLIGLCLDTGHIIRSGEDPVAGAKQFKDRLYGMHLKDFVKNAQGKDQDAIIGDGKLDVKALVAFLKEIKYAGSASIEYEGGDPVKAVEAALGRIREAAKA